MQLTGKWIDYDLSFIRRRYDQIAGFFVFFEWLFLLRPLTLWIMKPTVLGNPDLRPWDELRELIADFDTQELMFGTYYVCRGRKPLVAI